MNLPFRSKHAWLNLQQRGAAMVEAALSMGIFFIFIFMTTDLMRVAFQAATLQYAVSAGSRWAVLGEKLPNPQIPGAMYPRTKSVEVKITSLASTFGVQPTSIKICPSYNPTCATNNAGLGGDLISIKAIKTVPLLFLGNTGVTVSAVALVKNEPFV